MPPVQANGIEIYYEVQGEGEPLVPLPYLAEFVQRHRAGA